MLSSIISKNDEEFAQKPKENDSDSSPERIKHELLESMKKKKREQEDKYVEIAKKNLLHDF